MHTPSSISSVIICSFSFSSFSVIMLSDLQHTTETYISHTHTQFPLWTKYQIQGLFTSVKSPISSSTDFCIFQPNNLSTLILHSCIESKIAQGRPKKCRKDDIKHRTEKTFVECIRLAQDRHICRELVSAVTDVQT